MQRVEGVDHHCVFISGFLADALLVLARMRAVWNAAGMLGNTAFIYALAAHEVTLYIVEYLVGIDIAMRVRRRDGLRVVVVLARAEGANHVVGSLKGLVHGRRLVHATGNGLKVLNVEYPRVEVAVPAHHVERMMLVPV